MKKDGSLHQILGKLKSTGWILHVSHNIYTAHKARLLPLWHFGDALFELLNLLKEREISLRIPVWDEKYYGTLEREFPGLFVRIGVDSHECPPLPEPDVTDDDLWNHFLDQLGIGGRGNANKFFADGSWVYRVRFFPFGISQVGIKVKYRYPSDLEGLTETEVAERKAAYDAERGRVESEIRRMRKEFKLSAFFHAGRRKTFSGTLVVLKKIYPPDQVVRTRRREENILRRNPEEVIRYGLERRLLK